MDKMKIIKEDGDIDFIDYTLGDTTILHIAIKNIHGNIFIDARKWIKFSAIEEYRPTGKGLMIGKDNWKKVIPLIQDLIATLDK